MPVSDGRPGPGEMTRCVGRYATADAKAKIEAARERARATGSPLWLGVEAC